MNIRYQNALSCFLGLALAASTASAHRLWLLPSSHVLSGTDHWVTVDAAVSNDLFFPNHVALSPESIQIIEPDGEFGTIENAMKGHIRGTFDFHVSKEGTYRVLNQREGYFARWTEDGEGKRMRGDLAELKEAGVFAKEGVAVMKSLSRLETAVTVNNPTVDVFASTGEGIEFVPVTHPNDLFANEAVTFGFLLNGEPAKGLEVEVVRGDDRYRDEPGLQTLVTDAEGQIEISFDQPGRYWLDTSSSQDAGTLEGAPLSLRYGLTMTFEVLPE
ncbi:MAG: ABC transporter permease [Puniceicoccaceae bacterium]|nr:ABC transporter permease [Puniceicoccaceae bacterium]